MKTNQDVPGNAMQSTLNYQRRLIRMAETYQRLEHTLDRCYDDDILILGVSIRFPDPSGGEYLVTVRGQVDGELVVAFHAAQTFCELLEGFVNRLTNRSLRWKKDKYGSNGK